MQRYTTKQLIANKKSAHPACGEGYPQLPWDPASVELALSAVLVIWRMERLTTKRKSEPVLMINKGTLYFEHLDRNKLTS